LEQANFVKPVIELAGYVSNIRYRDLTIAQEVSQIEMAVQIYLIRKFD